MTLLLHLADFNERSWADRFAAALPGRRVVVRGDAYDPAEIEYIFIWKPRPEAFDGLVNLKAVLSLGAGVDALLRHPGLPRDVPVVRFMDEDLTQRMTDYVVQNVSLHHRLATRFKRDQAAKRWKQLYPAPAVHPLHHFSGRRRPDRRGRGQRGWVRRWRGRVRERGRGDYVLPV